MLFTHQRLPGSVVPDRQKLDSEAGACLSNDPSPFVRDVAVWLGGRSAGAGWRAGVGPSYGHPQDRSKGRRREAKLTMASTTAAAATFPSSTSAAASWNPKSKADEGLEKDARRDVVDVEMDHDDNDDAQDDGPNDEDDAIDPEQLDEYKDMVERLGSFPVRIYDIGDQR
jgi:hypothetical protein